jgi:two-component system, sensor histidine kinase and response regulator
MCWPRWRAAPERRPGAPAVSLAGRFVAEAAIEAKGAFLARISHAIRTPLNAIVGLSGLALQAAGERQREHVAGVHAAARLLAGIVDDVLDCSKIDADRVEPETEA